MGQTYLSFVQASMDLIRTKVNDELWILNFFEVNQEALQVQGVQ